jgi:hypothetical protein
MDSESEPQEDLADEITYSVEEAKDWIFSNLASSGESGRRRRAINKNANQVKYESFLFRVAASAI